MLSSVAGYGAFPVFDGENGLVGPGDTFAIGETQNASVRRRKGDCGVGGVSVAVQFQEAKLMRTRSERKCSSGQTKHAGLGQRPARFEEFGVAQEDDIGND